MTTQASIALEDAGERPLQAGNALRSLADWGMDETTATTLGELFQTMSSAFGTGEENMRAASQKPEFVTSGENIRLRDELDPPSVFRRIYFVAILAVHKSMRMKAPCRTSAT